MNKSILILSSNVQIIPKGDTILVYSKWIENSFPIIPARPKVTLTLYTSTCGAHSWGVSHCHCPLEIRRPVALSLGDVATPATILLWPSSFLQQRTSTCESQDPQTGQEHRILDKGTPSHAHTLQGAAKVPKVVFNYTLSQMVQYKCHSRPALI